MDGVSDADAAAARHPVRARGGRGSVRMTRAAATTHRTLRLPRAADVLAYLPAAVFLGCSFGADMVAIAGRDPVGAWRILPAGPVSGNWIVAEVSSTGLLLISLALLR